MVGQGRSNREGCPSEQSGGGGSHSGMGHRSKRKGGKRTRQAVHDDATILEVKDQPAAGEKTKQRARVAIKPEQPAGEALSNTKSLCSREGFYAPFWDKLPSQSTESKG